MEALILKLGFNRDDLVALNPGAILFYRSQRH